MYFVRIRFAGVDYDSAPIKNLADAEYLCKDNWSAGLTSSVHTVATGEHV